MEAVPIPSMISFLFGMTGRDSLPGTVIVRLLADLDIPEAAGRSAIARMRTAGALTGIRRGRTTDYSLAGPAAHGFRHSRALAHTPSAPSWSGEFAGLLHRIPEAHRRHRDRLRNAATLVGYMPLRPGLMIGLTDQWSQLAPALAELPAGATVAPLTLRMRSEDARTAAAEAWRLDELDRHLRDLADLVRAALDQAPPPDDRAAMQALAELTLPIYRALVIVPDLPPELLPDTWAQPDLTRLLGQAHHWFGTATQRHLRLVLGQGS